MTSKAKASADPGAPGDDSYRSQFRLLLEEICCDLIRFQHMKKDALPAPSIHIDRQYPLGAHHADMRVAPDGLPPYYAEVKWGYSSPSLIQRVKHKYGAESSLDADRLVLIVDIDERPDWPQVQTDIEATLKPGLKLEVWSEASLRELVKQLFAHDLAAINEHSLLGVRQVIDRTTGFEAFNGESLKKYNHEHLHAELTWHFAFWRLKQLRETKELKARSLFAPGLYRGVAVIMADLCSFSSFVRDTPDEAVVRHCLTAFYSRARYQIINDGGMFYQFVGDEAIGMFGIPEHTPNYIQQALKTARALLNIGQSVASYWQRHIDRVQHSSGLHIGMAIGDLQIVSLRPFSRTHVGAIGDSINVAARLTNSASAGEIVVSNSLYNELDEQSQETMEELEPVEAHNVGMIKAWKFRNPSHANKAKVDAT